MLSEFQFLQFSSVSLKCFLCEEGFSAKLNKWPHGSVIKQHFSALVLRCYINVDIGKYTFGLETKRNVN